MKKLATLLFYPLLPLAGCSSIQRSLRGDDYIDSSISAEESSRSSCSGRQRFERCLTNENANFPQLSKEVAEDEAESFSTQVKVIYIKLFPKLAPQQLKTSSHAKEGYYNGIHFTVY